MNRLASSYLYRHAALRLPSSFPLRQHRRSGFLHGDFPGIDYWQVGMPRGNGNEHVLVTPSCVITIVAVAEPL